jgi:VWFA-related protein
LICDLRDLFLMGMGRHRFSCALSIAGLFAAVTLAAAQDPPPPSQTFRTAVDVVPVDVSVIGEGGKPVAGLAGGDFVLTVDGRPRRIASAQFVSAVRDQKPPASTPTYYSTNTASGGRLILFLVDQGSIGRGRGRAVMESVSRFVSQLTPADRVGLIAFPGSATQIDFTQNHALVQSALPRLVGQAETFDTTARIGVSEALAIQQGDRTALNTVIQRECAAQGGENLESCRTRVQTEAIGMASLVEERTQNTVAALRAVTDRLAALEAPKTVVFISEGLVLDRVSDLGWLGPAAARGQLTIQVLHLEAPAADASSAREAATPGRDRALARDGLNVIAGTTRGGVFQISGNADNALDRLALELSGYYLLSFEPESGDRDGKPHKIKVDVPGRSGTEIRARGEFSVGAPSARTDDTVLADTLQSPILASDIALRLAAFTLKDPEGDKLRLLMVAEIDRGANPEGRLALAYALSDENGRVIATQIDRDVKTPVQPASKTQTYTGFILSDATGPHTLKVAVLDDSGRRGSVEHKFRPALNTVGQIKAADLLLADDRVGGGKATPALGGEFTSGMVNGYIELYAPGDLLKNATVIFEVAENEEARAIDGAVGKVQPSSAEQPDRRAIEGTVPTALLPPGDYVARAVINADGRRVGQVARPFRVGRPVAATKPTAPATTMGLRSSSRAAPIQFMSRTEKFDRGSVLTPQVVGYFMGRLDFAARGEPNAAPAIDHAKAGNFEAALQALNTRSGTLPSAFLSGLAHFARGELEPAAAKFREALRLDSEFFPAAFYLGSCYAAGGRDKEAVGAWQLSLITESEAPFIFTLLGDALLREGDFNQALAVLNEAAAAWPDDDQVQVRIGAAYALAGKRADALPKFEAYLDKHPEDHDRHFAALRMLYEAKSEGKPVRSTAEDRALFTKWATAYANAKGPQQAMVSQWQRAIGR